MAITRRDLLKRGGLLTLGALFGCSNFPKNENLNKQPDSSNNFELGDLVGILKKTDLGGYSVRELEKDEDQTLLFRNSHPFKYKIIKDGNWVITKQIINPKPHVIKSSLTRLDVIDIMKSLFDRGNVEKEEHVLYIGYKGELDTKAGIAIEIGSSETVKMSHVDYRLAEKVVGCIPYNQREKYSLVFFHIHPKGAKYLSIYSGMIASAGDLVGHVTGKHLGMDVATSVVGSDIGYTEYASVFSKINTTLKNLMDVYMIKYDSELDKYHNTAINFLKQLPENDNRSRCEMYEFFMKEVEKANLIEKFKECGAVVRFCSYKE